MPFLMSFIGYVYSADTFKIIHDNEIRDQLYILHIYTGIGGSVLILFDINYVLFKNKKGNIK